MAETQGRMTTQELMEEQRGRPPITEDARQRMLMGMPVTERRLQLAGVSTALLEGGDGTPVVLLHGPSGYAAHWMRVIQGLVATHRVVAPDLPCHGTSEVTGGMLDSDRVLAWLGELIEHTCMLSPALLGQLLGGAIAARFASGRGDRLSLNGGPMSGLTSKADSILANLYVS
jgi:alpha-beta hydrolase superfamily lysophospholipase